MRPTAEELRSIIDELNDRRLINDACSHRLREDAGDDTILVGIALLGHLHALRDLGKLSPSDAERFIERLRIPKDVEEFHLARIRQRQERKRCLN